MSDYAYLEFNGLPVWEMCNHVDPVVMVLFVPRERAIRSELLDGDPIEVAEYRSSAARFIERLEILGFTMEDCRAGHESWKQALPQEIDLSEAEKALLSDFTFDVWKDCMRLIMDHGPSDLDAPPHLRPYMLMILDEFEFEYYIDCPKDDGYKDYCYGILGGLYVTWRAILEVCDPSDEVVFDYSSLIEWGSCERDDDLTVEPEKVIILTEGKTDREFIESALHLLRPDLSRYFSFLDFHAPNLAGGTSFLVHLLKGFVGAGIHNRVVAVFDNDTATQEALRPMIGVDLPDNIRVVRLPCLELASDYPTLGPQGRVSLDINGLACSIELFFGEDILRDETGELTPIQWTGYNKVLKRYQGEILNKDGLQRKYRELIAETDGSDPRASGHDWSGMDLLLNEIFGAFGQPQGRMA